ncbi:putative signal transducing protein [Halomonas sp. V046]|uniref:putative signal transducing protein n=1 Tax=Halomonas sp. V046 TaxID=3459611 RepID=UPI004044C3C3
MEQVAWVRVFSHGNAMLASHVRNVLAAAGMPCELRNMTLGGATGELPPLECEPQVWVAAHNQQRAEALIQSALDPAQGVPDWVCAGCGEHLDGAFDTCWNCARPRPAGALGDCGPGAAS